MICFIQCRILTASGRENRPHRSRTAPAQRNRFSSLSLMHIPQHKARALYGQIRFFRSVDADVRHGVDGRAPFMAATISSVTGTGRDLRPPRHGIIGKGIDRHGRTFFPHNHKIVRCVWQAANFSAKQQKRADRGIPADAPVFPRIGFNFPNGSAAYPRADTP